MLFGAELVVITWAKTRVSGEIETVAAAHAAEVAALRREHDMAMKQLHAELDDTETEVKTLRTLIYHLREVQVAAGLKP